MLEELFSKRVIKRIRTSKNSEWLELFALYLEKSGYKLNVIQSYVCSAEHFVNWLANHRIPTADRNTINKFLFEHLPVCQCPKPSAKRLITVRTALNHFYKALIQHGILKLPQLKLSFIEQELIKYDRYLEEICGLSSSTRIYRLRYTKEFLETLFKCNPIDYRKISYTHVINFITKRKDKLQPCSISGIATSLRSYFRFLVMNKQVDKTLIKIIPNVPNWKLSSIPKSLTEKEVTQLLSSFNRKEKTGQRDYAIALCFIELGLRTKEVVGLELDNINWRRETLSICHTKSLYERILPLSYKIGSAITDYLTFGRPISNSRNIFLRHTVPVGAPVTKELVRGIIRRAYARAGIIPPAAGPQVLRHTLATQMINKGVKIKEIADVLGHKSLESTAIYAKVDLTSLRNAAMPWPTWKEKE